MPLTPADINDIEGLAAKAAERAIYPLVWWSILLTVFAVGVVGWLCLHSSYYNEVRLQSYSDRDDLEARIRSLETGLPTIGKGLTKNWEAP